MLRKHLRKPFKKQKIEEFFFEQNFSKIFFRKFFFRKIFFRNFFSKNFLMKVSGKSPKTFSSPLCSQNVSFLVKIEAGFDENKF